jgi:hypothetical protein
MAVIRVAFEVDTGKLFDAVAKMEGDTRPIGERLVGVLMTGASSTALLARMLGASPDDATFGHPHDPSDFGRCHRLLEHVPEWRTRLPEMAACSAYWAALVDRWDEITALHAVVVSDYSSWVRPDDGSKCGVFEPK